METRSVQIYCTGWLPFETTGFNNCNGEFVSMTGVFLTEMQIGAADRFDGMNAVISWRLRGNGEGLTTGSKYIDAGEGGVAIMHIVSANDAFDFAIRVNGTLISRDGLAPDLYYSDLLHITLDANGNLKTSIENYKIICH